MEELSFSDYQTQSFKDIALFFKTPFCGTCQLAEQLLELTFQSMDGQPLPTFICRAEEWQTLIHEWQIASVPCLVFIKGQQVVEKLYAFESVTKLYQLYKTYG